MIRKISKIVWKITKKVKTFTTKCPESGKNIFPINLGKFNQTKK